MLEDILKPAENLAELRWALDVRYGIHAFGNCQTMGDLTATHLRMLTEG